MRGKLFRPGLGALAVVGALLLAGGVAYATVPDGNGVIHGCYAKTSNGQAQAGALRVIDTGQGQSCFASENALAWNQQEVKGATGPQGPQGPQGVPGQTGPSDVWSGDGYGSGASIGGSFVPLATVNVPAGSYAVESEANLFDVTTPTTYSCDLVDSSINEYQFITTQTGSTGDSATVPLQAVVTFASPNSISLRCLSADSSGRADDWKLAAIKIGTAH